MKEKRDLFSTITIIIALLVILFIGSAICAIIIGGLPNLFDAFCSKEIQFAFGLSVSTACISTIIVMILALPTAYALTKTNMPCKKIAGVIIELTLSLPFLLLGLSLLILFSTNAGKALKEMGI